MAQLSFATLDHQNKKKRTKRERVLAEMDAVVPWALWIALIEPYYPKAGKRRGPYPLEVVLRIYFLQQSYQLSDPGAEEALYDIQSMRAFVGLELGRDAIPDETTILNFRHLLERHELTKALFEAVSEHLEDKAAGVTTGKVHDAKVMDNLIREDDRAVFADKGYVNEKKKRAARAAGVCWAVKEQRKPGRQLSSSQKKRNKRHGTVSAKVEHLFRVMKCQFGYRCVRYRGIAKNGAQEFALLALANLYLS
jgi:IS5 family transposase